jgi:hypothetical protein
MIRMWAALAVLGAAAILAFFVVGIPNPFGGSEENEFDLLRTPAPMPTETATATAASTPAAVPTAMPTTPPQEPSAGMTIIIIPIPVFVGVAEAETRAEAGARPVPTATATPAPRAAPTPTPAARATPRPYPKPDPVVRAAPAPVPTLQPTVVASQPSVKFIAPKFLKTVPRNGTVHIRWEVRGANTSQHRLWLMRTRPDGYVRLLLALPVTETSYDWLVSPGQLPGVYQIEARIVRIDGGPSTSTFSEMFAIEPRILKEPT